MHIQPFLLALVAVLVMGAALPAVAVQSAKATAKHIILIIGDGRQFLDEIATSRYLYGTDDGLSFHGLSYSGNVATWDVTTYDNHASRLNRPLYDPHAIDPRMGYDWRQAGMVPYPLGGAAKAIEYLIPPHDPDHPFATDSASSATAMATGYKTDDGRIAWLPGTPAPVAGQLKTIAQLLRDRLGYAIGVVSTVPFSHATPAAMVSHNRKRGNYHEIASEILTAVKPEVVIGGGFPGISGTNAFRFLSQATYDAVRTDSHYQVVERQTGVDGALSLLEAAQTAVAGGKRLFGLYGGPLGNFESPLPHDLPGTPLVTRATTENPLLKDCILAALQVLTQDPDGLFLMAEQGDIDWANHANDFSRMVGNTWDLHEAVKTVVDYVNRPGDSMDWTNTLLLVVADHATGYLRLEKRLGAGDLPVQIADQDRGYTYPNGEVTYASHNHSNELVRLYAAGVRAKDLLKSTEGTWYPCTKIIDNTQLFHVMAEAASVPVQSPLRVVRRPCRH